MTNEEARALVERLKNYAEHPSSFTDISPTEADAAADLIEALLAERDSFEALWRSTMDVLEAERKERDSAVLAEREEAAEAERRAMEVAKARAAEIAAEAAERKRKNEDTGQQ